MLFQKTIPVCSRTHTKHVNALLRKIFELTNVKHGGTHSIGQVIRVELPLRFEQVSFRTGWLTCIQTMVYQTVTCVPLLVRQLFFPRMWPQKKSKYVNQYTFEYAIKHKACVVANTQRCWQPVLRILTFLKYVNIGGTFSF